MLVLVQSWIEPLIYLQTTLNHYDNAPDTVINKTKWVSEKLLSLEQGLLVLIRKVHCLFFLSLSSSLFLSLLPLSVHLVF